MEKYFPFTRETAPTKLEIVQPIVPTDISASLNRAGINIDILGQLSGKNFPKGSLIEVESNQEKLVISVE